MKIDFSQAMKNFDGSEAEHEGAPLTLGIVCAHALNVRAEQGEKAEDMSGNGMLALHIYNGGEVSITAKQITITQEKLGKLWPAAIQHQAYVMLEPSDEKPKK